MSLLGLFVPEMIQVSEGRTDKSIPEVDLSQAVKIGRLSDGLIRYTFDLSSNQPHVFSNLIVIEHPEHEPMSYITEYHPDRDWLIEKAGNWKAIDYTGYVLTKALDGQVLTVSEYEHGEGDIFKYDPEAGEAGRTACDPLFGWSPGDFTGWVDVGNGSWSNFNTGTSSFSSGDPSGGSWTIIIIKTTQPDDDFSGDGENPSGGGSDPWVTRTSCGGGYDPNAILCNGTGNCSQVTAVTSVFCEDECDEEELCDQNPLTTWVAGECECTFGKGENGECVSQAEAWEDVILFEDQLGDITDIQSYLDCFNSSSSGSLTVYVDQPDTGSRDTWKDNDPSVFGVDPDVGHTFISITQGDVTRVLGFYPDEGITPGIDPNSPSTLIDDSGHHFDVSITISINSTQMNSLIDFISSYESNYNLNSYNCTDFAIDAASQCGLQLPDTYGSWPFGGGSNPGDLGEDIRAMNSSNVNKQGGVSETNEGNCEE